MNKIQLVSLASLSLSALAVFAVACGSDDSSPGATTVAAGTSAAGHSGGATAAGSNAGGASAAGNSAAGNSAGGANAAGSNAGGSTGAGANQGGAAQGGADQGGAAQGGADQGGAAQGGAATTKYAQINLTVDDTKTVVLTTTTESIANIASATFGVDPTTPPTPNTNCTTTAANGCTTLICQTAGAGGSGAGSGGSGSGKSADSGVITISGSANHAPITLTPSDTGAYAPFSETGSTGLPGSTPPAPFFKGGESIAVSAPGNDGPAFSETLTAPGGIAITAPAQAQSATTFQQGITVDTTQDLAVTWTGTNGQVSFSIIAITSSESVIVACVADASAATLTVPKDALASIPMNPTSATYSVLVQSKSTMDFADYSVAVNLTTPGLDANGAGYSGQVTLQ